MEKAVINGITLEYEVSGAGEPVLFIHGAFIADAFAPLLIEPSLSGLCRFITYNRRGYMGSSYTPGPITLEQQAMDCRELLRYLGENHVHVVGESAGARVALKLALDFPEVVHSLTLMEPALMIGESAQAYRESLAQGVQRYHEVGAEIVAHEFIGARWPEYASKLDAALPGGFAQAVRNARATFELDIGMLDWDFGITEAQGIPQPTLVVVGGGSVALSPRFEEVHQFLLDHIPDAEGFILPDATHFLHLESATAARQMAEGLADFYVRHPKIG